MIPEIKPFPKLLKMQQVADILLISKTSVSRLINQGQLKCVRFGDRCVRIREEDLKKFIERNLQG